MGVLFKKLKMIDLNKIPPKILFILNILVIILLIASTIMLITDIIYVKKYGGQCLQNPMVWAENYALEEKNILINCECNQLYNFPLLNLNMSEVQNEGNTTNRTN
ncbi:MAG: hypothetical protein ACOCUD_01745 [Bacillota bacterium]